MQTLFAGWFALSAFRFITIESVGRGLVSRRYTNLLIFFRMMKIQNISRIDIWKMRFCDVMWCPGADFLRRILAPALRILSLQIEKPTRQTNRQTAFAKRALPKGEAFDLSQHKTKTNRGRFVSALFGVNSPFYDFNLSQRP